MEVRFLGQGHELHDWEILEPRKAGKLPNDIRVLLHTVHTGKWFTPENYRTWSGKNPIFLRHRHTAGNFRFDFGMGSRCVRVVYQCMHWIYDISCLLNYYQSSAGLYQRGFFPPWVYTRSIIFPLICSSADLFQTVNALHSWPWNLHNACSNCQHCSYHLGAVQKWCQLLLTK